MKCIKCRTENINNANYCQNCKYHFSKEEQKIAKRKTIPGKLERIEEIYNKCTLKVITDHIIFKIILLLIVIVLGIIFYQNNGDTTKILEREIYQIQYNTKEQEYYLLVKEEEAILNLYIPNKVKKLTIKHLDQNNQQIEEIIYQEEPIILSTNEENDYYLLESKYANNTIKQIKLNVYKVAD